MNMLNLLPMLMGAGNNADAPQLDVPCGYCAYTTDCYRQECVLAGVEPSAPPPESPPATLVAGTLVCRKHTGLALEDAYGCRQ